MPKHIISIIYIFIVVSVIHSALTFYCFTEKVRLADKFLKNGSRILDKYLNDDFEIIGEDDYDR
jgi:hypothetical protein